ncbi:hypothetical protein XENOCAPTIV_023291, partial [Xenoophorus captivus]
CETMLELYEEVVEDWYFHHQDQRLESFLCENHVLKTSERGMTQKRRDAQCLVTQSPHLRSATSSQLQIPRTQRTSTGERASCTASYSDQPKPLLTYSDLAALEASSQSEDPAANEEHQALVVSCQEDSMEIVMRPHLLDPNPPSGACRTKTRTIWFWMGLLHRQAFCRWRLHHQGSSG